MPDDSDRWREGSVYADRRAYDELVGLCRAVLFDGKLPDEEIVRLEAWCRQYPGAATEWPGEFIARRVREVLADGVVDESERAELIEDLTRLTGQREDEYNRPTELPLTKPAPDVVFAGRGFCLTGTFDFGKRRQCEQAVIDRGGTTQKYVSRKVDYVVIGTHSTPAWIHSTHGTKIQAAMGYPEIAIIAESHWRRFLDCPA